jgi:hypothetical protein
VPFKSAQIVAQSGLVYLGPAHALFTVHFTTPPPSHPVDRYAEIGRTRSPPPPFQFPTTVPQRLPGLPLQMASRADELPLAPASARLQLSPPHIYFQSKGTYQLLNCSQISYIALLYLLFRLSKECTRTDFAMDSMYFILHSYLIAVVWVAEAIAHKQ